jgi:hypothetical protein
VRPLALELREIVQDDVEVEPAVVVVVLGPATIPVPELGRLVIPNAL